uniref:Uncharacterized protein n=1 Tax=Romanomermis culicivorax TaxID=13658 RepID=A0A915I7R8_ROMCU
MQSVEYYPDDDDNWSLCNYGSDSCKSLRERTERCVMPCGVIEPQSPTYSMQSLTDSHNTLLPHNDQNDVLPPPSLNDGLVFLNAENLLEMGQQHICLPAEIRAYSRSNAFTTNVLLDNPSFFDYPCVI